MLCRGLQDLVHHEYRKWQKLLATLQRSLSKLWAEGNCILWKMSRLLPEEVREIKGACVVHSCQRGRDYLSHAPSQVIYCKCSDSVRNPQVAFLLLPLLDWRRFIFDALLCSVAPSAQFIMHLHAHLVALLVAPLELLTLALTCSAWPWTALQRPALILQSWTSVHYKCVRHRIK